MIGGSGADVFVLSHKKDTVTDFDLKKDTIGIPHKLNLKVTQSGKNINIKGDGNVRMVIENMEKKDFIDQIGDTSMLPIIDINAI